MPNPKRESAAISRVASAIVLVILVAAATLGVAAYYQGAPAKETTELATLQANGEFSTFVNALSSAGLSGTLSGSTPYTLFAPTNEAFSDLPPGALATLLANRTELVSVLSYHIVAGELNTTDMFPMTSLTTLQGSPLSIGVYLTGLEVGNNASLDQPQILCTNGYIYPINAVLFPPSAVKAPLGVTTVFQTIQALGLNYLVSGLETAALASMLSSPGSYTLLAPTNSAMTFFSCGSPDDNCLADLENLFENQSAVTYVMQDNIVSGNFTTAQLVQAGSLTTLAGQTLQVKSASGTVNVGLATITQKDIRCSNGYVDITDLILVPPGVNH
ncbi:MAG: fasciclin domain-containing protein [Thaumarchaeota archaeon]|nr:fasciclin domain-containing protein [Nitrososphaerota archaeon]